MSKTKVSANIQIDLDDYLTDHTNYDAKYITSLDRKDKIKLLEIDLLSYDNIPEIKIAKFTEVTEDRRSMGGH